MKTYVHRIDETLKSLFFSILKIVYDFQKAANLQYTKNCRKRESEKEKRTELGIVL